MSSSHDQHNNQEGQQRQQSRNVRKNEFVVVTSIQDAKSDKVRKQVRSSTTKLQHHRARNANANANAKTHASSNNGRPLARCATSSASLSEKSRFRINPQLERASSTSRPTSVDANTRSARQEHGQKATSIQPKPYANGSAPADATQTADASFLRPVPDHALTRGSMAARAFLFHDSDNDVGISLKHLGYDLASTLECYKFICQVQAKDFEQNIPDLPNIEPGTTWPSLFQRLFEDPAVLTGAVLLTVTRRGRYWERPNASGWYHILRLRGFLLRTIHEAFQDPIRCICDNMLVAVALASAFEVRYSFEAYDIHLTGLVRMINMRGGLSQIALSHILVERFLLWHVANTSKMAREDNPYYQEISKTSSVYLPKADKEMFELKDYAAMIQHG